MKVELCSPPVEDQPFCMVTLTKHEAELLAALLGNVGGSHPLHTKMAEPLYYALRRVGVVQTKCKVPAIYVND
jgi:hypothetical protein